MTPQRLHALLILAAATGGALAPLVGSPYLERHAGIDVVDLAATVAREGDQVKATELAGWIKDRKPGLRVIDVRSEADYDLYHVPTAEVVPLETLAAARFTRSDTLVLYSEEGSHAAQAWVFLRALGYRQVYFLRGGLDKWLDEVMNPTIESDASPERAAAFARVAALSRYFGGVPRVGDVSATPGPSSRTVPPGGRHSSSRARGAAVRRQGC